jgi:signal transduction histidine kinase
MVCRTAEHGSISQQRRALDLSGTVIPMHRPAQRITETLRRHPTAADAGLAAVLAVSGLVALYAAFELMRQDAHFVLPAKPPLVLAVLAVTLPLTWRRRFPLTIAATVIVTFVTTRVILAPDVPFLTAWEGYATVWACWLALYSAVVHRRDTRHATPLLAALVALLCAEIVREVFFHAHGGAFRGLPLNQAFVVVYNTLFLVWPLALGATVRSLRERGRELAARTDQLQREREENARRAVLEERVRIARELHDVVAHHVSVMGVQAGAARRVIDRRPQQAQEILGSIEGSSRQAVTELHRLLGFLRRDGHADALAPQPRLAQLGDLAADAGLAVDLVVAGEPRELPATLELSAYRVIQEALTNARKHSGGTAATVRVDYRPAELQIEVCDDGRDRPARAQPSGGHGLLGMRERVRLHGGHLRAGPGSDGGFEVHATFPLNAEHA